MTRNTEGALIVAASVLAAFGVTLVNFAQERCRRPDRAHLSRLPDRLRRAPYGCAGVRAQSHSLLLAPVTALTALGFFQIYRLDFAAGTDRASFQRWWILIAAGLASLTLLLFNRSSISVLRRYRNITLLISMVLILLPNLPAGWGFPLRGLSVNGSRLWVLLDVGFNTFQFQPAELAKLGLVAYVAGYLADHQKALREAGRHIGPIAFLEPRQLIPLLITWGVSVLILISQRDLGASLLLFVGFVLLLYAATGTTGYLVAGGFLGLIAGLASYLAFDHVQRRVIAWVAPFEHYEDEGFQIAQGLFAMGTGSPLGAGPGLGRPRISSQRATDFIFAAVGEELGFAGTVSVLALFALTISVGLGIAFRSRDIPQAASGRAHLRSGRPDHLDHRRRCSARAPHRHHPSHSCRMAALPWWGTPILIALLLRISHEEAT